MSVILETELQDSLSSDECNCPSCICGGPVVDDEGSCGRKECLTQMETDQLDTELTPAERLGMR